MIAPRLLPRNEWERHLRQLGCAPANVGDRPGLETGEWWVTEHDFLFPVPRDENGLVRADDWNIVQANLVRLRPIE